MKGAVHRGTSLSKVLPINVLSSKARAILETTTRNRAAASRALSSEPNNGPPIAARASTQRPRALFCTGNPNTGEPGPAAPGLVFHGITFGDAEKEYPADFAMIEVHDSVGHLYSDLKMEGVSVGIRMVGKNEGHTIQMTTEGVNSPVVVADESSLSESTIDISAKR